jgi:hypothetical protein
MDVGRTWLSKMVRDYAACAKMRIGTERTKNSFLASLKPAVLFSLFRVLQCKITHLLRLLCTLRFEGGQSAFWETVENGRLHCPRCIRPYWSLLCVKVYIVSRGRSAMEAGNESALESRIGAVLDHIEISHHVRSHVANAHIISMCL